MLQERELAAFKVRSLYSALLTRVDETHLPQRANNIAATLREAGPDDTEESLEAERAAAQSFIDNGMFPSPLSVTIRLRYRSHSRTADGGRS